MVGDARVTLDLPDEFVELCRCDMVPPETVLKEFIADLCSISGSGADEHMYGYICNLAGDRDRARAYYDLLHGWKAEWIRENLPHLVKP
jgi:hypothetical protein